MKSRVVLVVTVAASIFGGAAAGIALYGPSLAGAQTSPATTTAATAADSAPRVSGLPTRVSAALQKLVDDKTITQVQADAVKKALIDAKPAERALRPGVGMARGPKGDAMRADRAADVAIAAKTIGISEADLVKALKSGETLGQVAKDHNVDPQRVIDALTVDEQNEVAQRIADRVNGVTPAAAPGDAPAGGDTPGPSADQAPIAG